MQVQAINLGVGVSTLNRSHRLFCRLDGLTPVVREQRRVATLKSLGLLEAESVPVFDEATQTAARFLEAPICTLEIMVQDQLWIKSAVGLSRLGLMNQLASSRKIPRQEAFSTYVVDSEQSLIIDDTLTESFFARSLLVQHYGIRSYIGSPLITADGKCLGALAVMDLQPRQFTSKDLEFLTLNARWCLREYEREHLIKIHSSPDDEWLILNSSSPEATLDSTAPRTPSSEQPANPISHIKLKLLGQLSQELRTPLTAIIGMSSVLQNQVFGSLSHKQKEYLDIIHTSGQHLNSLVEEILKLGVVEEQVAQLQLSAVNIEMLCQHALNSLEQMASQKRQQLRLSVEPGKRIWLLDKDKVRQALYYLVMSVIESSESGGEVRIHVSRRSKTLNLAVWVSHPWLGDGLPQVISPISSVLESVGVVSPQKPERFLATERDLDLRTGSQVLTVSSLESAINGASNGQLSSHRNPQELLGLLLSCYLAENHGGKIVVQGSPEVGHRYVMMLPKLAAEEDH